MSVHPGRRQLSHHDHTFSTFEIRAYHGCHHEQYSLCAGVGSSHDMMHPRFYSRLTETWWASGVHDDLWMGHGPERRLRAIRGPCAGFGCRRPVLPCGIVELVLGKFGYRDLDGTAEWKCIVSTLAKIRDAHIMECLLGL
jgi:hypothetical protein